MANEPEPETLSRRESPAHPVPVPAAVEAAPAGARRRPDLGEPRPVRGRFGLVVLLGVACYLAALGLMVAMGGRGDEEPPTAPGPAAASPEGASRAQ